MHFRKNEKFAVIESQFACAVPVKKINWQNVLNELTWDDQTVLLQKTVQSPILEKYPLQVKYVIRFLRHIIDALESRNAEIHDELYEIFCDYQAKGTQLDHTDYSYKHYHINNDEENVTITLKENHNIISQGTTGLNVWEAALAMCEWSLNNVTSICGKHVLELGAGTGLSGLVIGKCCQPASITLTDGDDNVLDYLDENVRNNFERNERDNYFRGQTSVDVLKLDWFDAAALVENDRFWQRISLPDLIIAADVVYDNLLFRPLCQTIDSIFTKCKNRCKMLLGNAVRNEKTQTEFFDLLKTYAFDVHEEKPISPMHFYWELNEICPIKLYAISRSGQSSCVYVVNDRP